MDWSPLALSLRLALLSTAILLVVGVPLARWIGLSRGWSSKVVRALVQIPMVLPPTVVGFYLLVVLSPGSSIGQFLDQSLGVRLLFRFPGLVVASVLTGLPFLVSSVVSGFQSLPASLREASLCLGRSPWVTFWKVELPLTLPAILAGCILAFLHTLGEFGVVLMIGGKLPGETRTVSIQLYDMVEQMEFSSAHRLALALVLLAFSGMLALFALQRGVKK